MQERVESPVDLSVRTVRRSADSTAWQGEAGADTEPEDCDSTAPPAPRPRRTAVMPRVHFMPEFSVAQFSQLHQLQRREEQLQEQRRELQAAREAREAVPPPSRQLPLPGMSTLAQLQLPWSRLSSVSAAGSPAASPGVPQHSQLLPLFSSNRSSLYPSSSAPALPPHAADPTGYLFHPTMPPAATPDTRAAPSTAPIAAPSPAMAPLLRLETPTATTTTELEPESLQETAPVRFRTKAEMKMVSSLSG